MITHLLRLRARASLLAFGRALIHLVLVLSLLTGCQQSRHRSDSQDPEDLPTPYGMGRKALRDKDAETAIFMFSRCLTTEPRNSNCHWELGWSHFLARDYAKALLEWQNVKKLEPKREGLEQALEKAQDHLDVLTRSWALRSTTLSSFNPRRRPSSTLIKIHAAGDTMLGTDSPKPMLPPDGVSPLFAAHELLSGSDITFLNYEGTLCDHGKSEKCEGAEGSCYAFRTPTRYSKLLKEAGIDVVSLANNHVMDFGPECRAETEKALDQAGILYSGRPGSVARFERKGIPISLIAFHSASHTNSTLDLKESARLIRIEKANRRLVIVSFHGGAEGFPALHTPKTPENFMGENRGSVIEFARTMVRAGADLVLGSGPHVVRGIELYRDRLIAYSLGNFATYKAFNLWGFNGIGLILEVEMDPKGKFVAGRILPTRQIEFGIPNADSTQMATDLIRLLTIEDFPASGVVVAQDGTIGKKAEAARRIASERAKIKHNKKRKPR